MDSYVQADTATTNYGNATTLRADGSPVTNSYLRFNVQNLVGTVSAATLRLYSNSDSGSGFSLHPVSDSPWTEDGLTYNNAPALGSVVATSGSLVANSWKAIDVKSLVDGNGVINLGISRTSASSINFSSREGANSPVLEVTVTLPDEETKSLFLPLISGHS
jgi:hypothetical protein